MAEEGIDPGRHVGESVTFRGTAWTAAAGAMVSPSAGLPVYIHGLDSWPPELEGKPVEVTGVVQKRVSEPPPDFGGLPLHDVDPETFLLHDAEWVLVGS